MTKPTTLTAALACALVYAAPLSAQEPVAWGERLYFHTFSIAAIDPATGESGVAVTTRVACVGNGVPWVKAGVGAVATQAWTRVAYGPELLEMMSGGMAAESALAERLAADTMAAFRQVGAIGLTAGSAQHTGDSTIAWAGGRSGPNYVTQGNLLVGPGVVEAVGRSFESTEGSGRHLADRLIEALAAGQAEGGDARKGRAQSAAVVVADPRAGRSRRPDMITANINVCEHPTPIAELRRIYDNISQTLGFRTLQQYAGRDVWQVKLIMHALGYYRADEPELERDEAAFLYTQDIIDAVDEFRTENGLTTRTLGSPPGLVDAATVELMWAELERRGLASEMRERLSGLIAVRR